MQEVYIVQQRMMPVSKGFAVTAPFAPTQELPPILAGARALLKESSPSNDLFVHGRDVANLLLRWGADYELAAAARQHQPLIQLGMGSGGHGPVAARWSLHQDVIVTQHHAEDNSALILIHKNPRDLCWSGK